jgi:hypothetical protein
VNDTRTEQPSSNPHQNVILFALTVDVQRYGKNLGIDDIILTHINHMFNCGIHPCSLKCHQISDLPQMPRHHPYSSMCLVNHALQRKCHQSKPDPCPVCIKEAERAESGKWVYIL